MNIFDYIFSCFSYIINILDNDFFGFGFSYLDFILADSLISIIIKFLFQGFNEFDRFNGLSISNSSKVLKNISNNERERQITTINEDLNTGSTTIIRSSKTYNRKGKVTGIVNQRYKY